MDPKEFSRLPLLQKLEILKVEGDYIGAREVPFYFVYLYTLEDFFVEVYRTKTLNQIQWIEVQSNTDLLSEYVEVDNLF
jgi:hypothetical protein